MEGLGENDHCLIGPAHGLRGNSMESDKYALDISNNRQALRDISHTVGNTPQPCAVTKRPLTQWILKSVASPGDGLPICQQPQESNTRHDVIEVEKLKDNVLDKMEEMDNRELEEIERGYVVLDIDTCDVKYPLAVVEYVEDLYIFYQQAEVAIGVSPDYISIQYDINEKMRAILVDWLVEVHYKFELMDENLFLTVNLIDRFLERQIVVRKKLQLVGVTAVLLACKFQDVSVPSVENLILITDCAYTRNEVLEMEMLMLNTLQFEMCVPTPYVFMRRFLKAAEADTKMKHLSFFMTELCLVEYEMLKFRPSFLAAAATYAAQCTLRGFKYWSRTSQLHTNYAEDQLLECSRLMVDFHGRAGTGQLTGVYRKYITFRYGCAAKFKPALFLLH